MENHKKIVLICPKSTTVMSFRKRLIQTLNESNYDVSVIVFDSQYNKEIESFGAKVYSIDEENRSLNPLKILKLKNKIKNILCEINPDVVFTFMLKPNIFGVLAAKSAKVKKIYAMVEGAGDVFSEKTLKWKLIKQVVCFLYRISLPKCKKVFFLNDDDSTEFVKLHLVNIKQVEMIHGIGVDLDYFNKEKIVNHNSFLMIARMLNTKGVMEYCEAAQRIKAKYPDATFNYIGAEGTIKLSDIQSYIDNGSINYLGTFDDVRPYYKQCGVFVLPSYYREGLPMSIMEAESMGRAIITTDNIGCRETVKDGINGFLIPTHSVDELEKKMELLINNKELVIRMGQNSRYFAEKEFDEKKINKQILETING